MADRKQIQQVSPIEYLSNDREPLPPWLKNHTKDMPIRLADLWTCRVVYNPGAGTEGSPIRTFNSSHAAHVFVYVDYGFTKEEIDHALSDDAFLGYHLHHEQTISANELLSHPPIYHLTIEEHANVMEAYKGMRIPIQNSYGILKIYQRNEDMGEEHGAWRFAVLYLGADAIATYDALFGNTKCSPFACVVDAYGFCNAYDHFAKNSLLEKIAKRTDRLPRYLLCAHHCQGWDGYKMLKSVSGTRQRFLWIKE